MDEGVVLTRSAFRHGIDEADIRHAWRHAIRLVEYEYDGQERLLAIGPDEHGAMLELLQCPPMRPQRIIHADRLRPSRYEYLR